jgi:hypothetical protein
LGRFDKAADFDDAFLPPELFCLRFCLGKKNAWAKESKASCNHKPNSER